MKRKMITAVLMLTLCFGMSGCGVNQIPEMTKDELQRVGEYAAITLMKYDANNRSRLVELPEENLPEIPETEEQPPIETEQPSGMKPVEDTPVVNPGETENSYTMEEVMELPEGMNVSYEKYEICDTYPADGAEYAFAISATKGKKLLILYFSLANDSGQEQKVDLLSGDIVYRITANKGASRYALMTMLQNDMTTFSGTITVGGNEEVVLVTEVDENVAAELATVSLKIKNESKTHTIQLF